MTESSDRPLKVLFIEDSPEDAELEEREMRRAGLAMSALRVETPDEVLRALHEFRPDVVVCDYSLPQIDGLGALRLVREHAPRTPFIFVSGTIGEERAVNSLKEGATDYVLKERLGRLAHAVVRAMKEADAARERESLEEQFRHSQKLEAIGKLAGGVAHDFNNLLTIINGYTQIAMQNVKEGPDRSTLEEVLKAGQRAAALTRQLLAFSRRQMLAPQVINLNEIVRELEKMLRRLLGEDIDFRVDLDPALGNCMADPGQIEQVIMNLVVNARDAMPGGGRLAIETRNMGFDRSTPPEAAPGLYVALSVTDTGHGMDREVQTHIFEPFFTTKPVGSGTGLGLSTAYGIVKQSEGHITVASEVGRGTTFRVFLPRVSETATALRRATSTAAAPRGTETIFVVEDSDGVRSLIESVLRGQGYTVLSASNGTDALELADKYAQDIHLLLTDVVMPRLGGEELATHLAGKRPRMKVLFTSGYADRPGGAAWRGDTQFLQKPFTLLGLTKAVREALDA